MDALRIFVSVGLFCLIWQTYSDIKTQEVDSRRTWLMYGVLLTLILVASLNFWFYLAAIIGTAIVSSAKFMPMLGDGDREALRWIFPGFLVLDYWLGITYLLSFCFLLAFYALARRLLKIKGTTPGFPVLFGAFVINAAIAWLTPELPRLLGLLAFAAVNGLL